MPALARLIPTKRQIHPISATMEPIAIPVFDPLALE